MTWEVVVLPFSPPGNCFLRWAVVTRSTLWTRARARARVSVCLSGSWWGALGSWGRPRIISRWCLLVPVLAVPGGASSEASFVVKVLRVFVFDIVSRAGAGTAEAAAAEPGEVPGKRTGGEGRRSGCARPLRALLSKAHRPLRVCAGCSGSLAPGELGSVESRSPVPMNWGGWKSWRAELSLDTLVVMKSTRLKVLTGLPEV